MKPPSLSWTLEWPTQEGWYWTWNPTERRGQPRVANVRHAGTEPKKFWIYIQGGAYLFRSEKSHQGIWWDGPLAPPAAPEDSP